MTAPDFRHCDPTHVLEAVEYDFESVTDLVSTFLSTLPPRLDQLSTAAASGNHRAARDEAHALKGSLAIFDAKLARDIAEAIERDGKDKSSEQLKEMVAGLERELRFVCAELRQCLDPGFAEACR